MNLKVQGHIYTLKAKVVSSRSENTNRARCVQRKMRQCIKLKSIKNIIYVYKKGLLKHITGVNVSLRLISPNIIKLTKIISFTNNTLIITKDK